MKKELQEIEKQRVQVRVRKAKPAKKRVMVGKAIRKKGRGRPMARATQFTVNTVDGMYGPMDEKTALAVVTSRVAHGEKVQVFRMIPCSVSMAINLSPPKRPYKTRQPKP
jgi:hypothetical protein